MTTNPLQYTELDAWAKWSGNEPTPWEAETIMRMDTAMLTAASDRSPPVGGTERVASIPVSDTREVTGLFRSLASRLGKGKRRDGDSSNT